MILNDKAIISDPCYEYGKYADGSYTIDVVPGEYISTVNILKGRVAEVNIVHADYEEESKVWELLGDVWVDSGDIGVFDYSLGTFLGDKEGDEFSQQFYDLCGDITCGANGYGGKENFFISRTFYGDGSYPLYVAKDNTGKVFAMYLRYFDGENDEL